MTSDELQYDFLDEKDHPFEMSRHAEDFDDLEHEGQEYVYFCLLCGLPVGPNAEDYCEQPKCKKTYEEFKVVAKLIAPEEEWWGHEWRQAANGFYCLDEENLAEWRPAKGYR